MSLLLLSLPWVVFGLYFALFVRIPPGLPLPRRRNLPLVSVIIPARNEEANIGGCLASLARSTYTPMEAVVVDDQSRDRTPEIVREMGREAPFPVRLVTGEPVPGGWFGKPWACWQGYREARGELLLFTDADTVHGPELLARSVEALEEEGGGALTLIGRQLMGSFWEQLLQPQFFMLLALRYPRVGASRRPRRWRHAIANGQYILIRRGVYEALGTHEAVRGEVVEDMRLAQLLVRGGEKLLVRGAGDAFATRMYRSLPGLVEGWSKNLATGAVQTVPEWMRPFFLPLALVVGGGLFLLPPVALGFALLAGESGLLLHWSLLTTGFGVLFWCLASAVMEGNPLYGLLYPVGAVVAGYIFLLSWFRGSRIQWKGRVYGPV